MRSLSKSVYACLKDLSSVAGQSLSYNQLNRYKIRTLLSLAHENMIDTNNTGIELTDDGRRELKRYEAQVL
ncbi:MAG TPA: hypothetical protein VJH04_02870 [archaeon]|nr:hypothetical protein [archaeon]